MDKKLSDEQLYQIMDEFFAASPEERKARKIGTGSSKNVYSIPNAEDYVVKRVNRFGEAPDIYDNHSFVEEYLASKQLPKDLPIEKPILVTKPGQDPLQIQRKLNTDVDFNEAERIRESIKAEQPFGKQMDLAPRNFGVDSEGSHKIHDFFDSSIDISPGKDSTRKKAIEKILGSQTPRIYRALPFIGPAIGAGLAAMSGEANAASSLPVLGEADNLGPEQGSEDWEIENPQQNPELRRQALEKLRR